MKELNSRLSFLSTVTGSHPVKTISEEDENGSGRPKSHSFAAVPSDEVKEERIRKAKSDASASLENISRVTSLAESPALENVPMINGVEERIDDVNEKTEPQKVEHETTPVINGENVPEVTSVGQKAPEAVSESLEAEMVSQEVKETREQERNQRSQESPGKLSLRIETQDEIVCDKNEDNNKGSIFSPVESAGDDNVADKPHDTVQRLESYDVVDVNAVNVSVDESTPIGIPETQPGGIKVEPTPAQKTDVEKEPNANQPSQDSVSEKATDSDNVKVNSETTDTSASQPTNGTAGKTKQSLLKDGERQDSFVEIGEESLKAAEVADDKNSKDEKAQDIVDGSGAEVVSEDEKGKKKSGKKRSLSPDRENLESRSNKRANSDERVEGNKEAGKENVHQPSEMVSKKGEDDEVFETLPDDRSEGKKRKRSKRLSMKSFRRKKSSEDKKKSDASDYAARKTSEERRKSCTVS